MSTKPFILKGSRLEYWLASGFGAGKSTRAPGTLGTLVAVPLYWGLKSASPSLYLAAIVLGFVFGVYICSRLSEELDCDDHPGIVWDEIVGFWIAMLGSPLLWQYILAGFLLFRFFDIVKPWPIRWCEQKVKGGLGIMLDDVLAGIFTAILLNFLPL